MKVTIRAALHRSLAPLAVLALLLSVTAGIVGAQAQQVALSGTQRVLFVGDAFRSWTSDGWTHSKGTELAGTFAYRGDGVSLSGTVSRLDDGKNSDAGGMVEGIITYTVAGTGVVCQGTSNGKFGSSGLTAGVDVHCSDGSSLRGTWRDVDPIFDAQGNLIGFAGTFTGTLVIPNL